MEKNKEGLVHRYIQYVFIALLIIAAFLIGSLYTKVQYLEKNGNAAAGSAKVQGKYASFEDAVKAIAKSVKLDEKKLISCMNSGEKQALVDADAKEGSELGVQGTPAFFVNGKFLGGAFPFANFKEIIDKELAGTSSTDVTAYSADLQSAAKSAAFDPVPKTVPVGSSPSQGPADAKVTIVVYSDFQCPYCSKGYTTMNEVLKAYGSSVRFVFKNFPLSQLHPHAQKMAEAAECAKDQGKFWEFHNKVFESQNDWSNL